ncbi:DMT family transporter [Sediminibacterium sp. KACHI17]|jgi:drug/metabolite transporter (DMT)-like permease|uniref:DMT family transporter n=1 Tax=Sediminibacterium sp. KACHI17 TaxID=1751071 RepID=A0AAT9GH77_9BACT
MKDALIKLHISVFLAGFTGVLGVLIHMNEGLLVWYRIMITVVTLFALLKWKNQLQEVSSHMVWKLLGIGTLIALHWVFFYGSIKMSNVSIGLVCFASTGLFTALLEPVFNERPFSWPDVGLGLLSLLGIILIFQFDTRYRDGIIAGIVSAILAALFSVLNKRQVQKVEPRTMMIYELSGGLLILTLLMPIYLHYYPVETIFPSLSDWFWLLILSWLCTVLAMDLMLQALKKVSAFTQNLSLNLEPVYGILLAFILFQENEKLNTSFYAGVALITVSVLFQMIRVIRKHQQKSNI